MTGRLALAAAGGLAGLCLWGLAELWSLALLPERPAFGLTVAGVVFFGGMLAMSGPLRLPAAAAGAALTGPAAGVLAWIVAGRFPGVTEALDALHPVAALAAVASLPLPFWIAARAGTGWADYPVLFREAWAMAMRAAAALLFVALAWALIFLSDAVLGLVDLRVIERLVDTAPVPWVVSGAVAGLALAVMAELDDVLSPDIAIRFLRILLPAVLAVLAVFVVALPLRGFARLGGLSVGATLLALAAVSAGLVTAAAEREAAGQVRGPLMVGATRALAALLPVPAAMAGWAVWIRVAEAGWSPARVAAATAAALALAYGLAYAAAVLRPGDWAARLRRANVGLAVLMLAVAAAWLTPVLDAETIAARDQVARVADGRTAPDEVDLWSLSRWGRPGAAAIAALETLSREPGREALAARLADRGSWGLPAPGPDPEVGRAELRRLMPVSPAAATAERDALIAALEPWEVDSALSACRAVLSTGAPGCVLAVADFWPESAGREALLLSRSDGGWLRADGFVPRASGVWDRRGVVQGYGSAVAAAEVEALILRLQSAPPVLRAVPLNALDTGTRPRDVFIIP